MKKIARDCDIVSGNADLEPIFSIKNFPVFQGCVDSNRVDDLLSDLDFYISPTSGMVQLNPLLPIDVIYQGEHNPGSVGQVWHRHHRCFAEFINKYWPKKIFEIGGSHGLLSENYYTLDPNCDWTIIEPAPAPVVELRAKLITGFFDDSTCIDQNTDMVVHSHVLEHMYNPQEFFNNLSRMPHETLMCFSIPNLNSNLLDKHTNALSFEHTYLCVEEYVEYWLAQSDYQMLEKIYHDQHSIFYAAIKKQHVTKLEMPTLYNKNKKLLDDFTAYYDKEISDINRVVQNWNGCVYLFGAHIFSQFLIAQGLKIEKIKCILDNSVLKQGLRLYGTNFSVASPKEIEDNSLVILRTGSYTEEIKKDILTNINPTTTFI